MNSKLFSLAVLAFFFTLTLCSSPHASAAPPPDPCALLSQPQISAALGASVDAPQHIAPKLCQWSTPKQPNATNAKTAVLTISSERAFGFAKTPVDSGTKAVPASGVCDDAVFVVSTDSAGQSTTQLHVKKAGSYVVIHIYGFPDQSKVMAIEKTLAVQACSNL